MKKYRVWAQIELQAIAENYHTLQAALPPGVEMLVVVKADAYGHGAVPVSRVVLEQGARMLGVGDSSEAIELRENGILADILILGALIEEELGWVVSYDLIPTIHSTDMIPLLEAEAARQNKQLRVHMKVDTGMGRLGAHPTSALALLEAISSSPHLRLEGLCTHLACAYEADCTVSRQQLDIFRDVVVACEKKVGPLRWKHAVNSGGLRRELLDGTNLVRPGIAVYGIDPGPLTARGLKVRPALSLHSQVTFLKGVREGVPVGYGSTYVTPRATMLATIPVGYNDGYPFRLSNRARVLLRGQSAPVAGTVTMDYTTVDVGHIPGVQVGDEVVLIGSNGKDAISVQELAGLLETVPYEITCSLGKRVRRIYR